MFYSNEPGVLVHPLWDTTTAYFAALELKQEPTENYVKYSFEFWECYEGYEQSLTLVKEPDEDKEDIFHTVTEGESIWDLAGQYGVSAEKILENNPQIKKPSECKHSRALYSCIVRR